MPLLAPFIKHSSTMTNMTFLYLEKLVLKLAGSCPPGIQLPWKYQVSRHWCTKEAQKVSAPFRQWPKRNLYTKHYFQTRTEGQLLPLYPHGILHSGTLHGSTLILNSCCGSSWNKNDCGHLKVQISVGWKLDKRILSVSSRCGLLLHVFSCSAEMFGKINTNFVPISHTVALGTQQQQKP